MGLFQVFFRIKAAALVIDLPPSLLERMQKTPRKFTMSSDQNPGDWLYIRDGIFPMYKGIIFCH